MIFHTIFQFKAFYMLNDSLLCAEKKSDLENMNDFLHFPTINAKNAFNRKKSYGVKQNKYFPKKRQLLQFIATKRKDFAI